MALLRRSLLFCDFEGFLWRFETFSSSGIRRSSPGPSGNSKDDVLDGVGGAESGDRQGESGTLKPTPWPGSSSIGDDGVGGADARTCFLPVGDLRGLGGSPFAWESLCPPPGCRKTADEGLGGAEVDRFLPRGDFCTPSVPPPFRSWRPVPGSATFGREGLDGADRDGFLLLPFGDL